MQKGNLTVEQQDDIKNIQEVITVGREDLEKPPSWLRDSVAKKEFKRIINEFRNIEVIGNLDLNNLGAYCNAYSFYIQATKELKGQPLTVQKVMPNGSYTTIENPLIKIQLKYSEEIRKFASLCGLTLDSRMKIGAIKTTQSKEKVNEDFGDI
ncbi:phage terminase small subunit P27 family [Clostridium botulinum]|nr:phage terminase small subunit P27 family [Clostridium botulinum]